MIRITHPGPGGKSPCVDLWFALRDHTSVEPVRIGIIGAGAVMSRLHMPALRKIPDAEIAVVCNSTTESAANFVRVNRLGAEVAVSWEHVIQRPDLDVIWITAPPGIHADAACAALGAGKHAFCQAPLCLDAAETAGVAAAALGRPNLVSAVCPSTYGFRYSPFVMELLRRQTLGPLKQLAFQGTRNTGVDPTAPPHWSQLVEMTGVNFLNVTLIADTLLRWVGAPSRLRAQTRVFTDVRDERLIDVPDYAVVFAEWSNGLRGHLSWSGMAHGPERNRFELHGEKASIIYDFDNEGIWLCQAGGRFQKIEVPPEFTAEWRVEEAFISAIRGEGPRPRPDFLDGVRCLALAESIHESAHADDWAEVHLPDEELFIS